MRHRPLVDALGVAVTAAVIAAGGVVATPGAASAQADSTPVTFTVTSGGIAITEPPAVTLSSVAASVLGTSVSGPLGTTTVTDSRGSTLGWTVSIAGPSAGFQDGVSSSDTIPDSAATVWVPATSLTVSPLLSAVPASLYATQIGGLVLTSSAQALVTATTVTSNTVTYIPSIAVTLGSSTVPGTYTGTVTQTVA